MMKRSVFQLGVLCTMVLLVVGCSKKDTTKQDLKTAIDAYYKVHPVCVWAQPRKFPVQAATADESKTEGFDALTDAGLLSRSTAEKQRFLIGSKQVNNYDLSENGRNAWTQDPTQPGYGNFCYGHPEVNSIDSFTTAVDSSGIKSAHVKYHLTVGDAPDWAKSAEVKTAFPDLSAALAGTEPAQTDLVMRGGHWHVTH